jgi:hypothetical protein
MIRLSNDGKLATFDADTGFVDFPGSAKKFTVRFDPQSKLYLSLANAVVEPDRSPRPGEVRNTLALVCSPDLRRWTVCRELLRHDDPSKYGFQYCDWQFAGDDLIAVVRTAFDDAAGGAHNYHDANYLTFHRVKSFRALLPQPDKITSKR